MYVYYLMTHEKRMYNMEKSGASPAKRLEVGRVYILSSRTCMGQGHLACTDDLKLESSGCLVKPLRHAMLSSISYCATWLTFFPSDVTTAQAFWDNLV